MAEKSTSLKGEGASGDETDTSRIARSVRRHGSYGVDKRFEISNLELIKALIDMTNLSSSFS